MSDESPPGTGSEQFQDPLEDYEPKVYDDPIKEALAEQTAGSIRHHPLTTISPDTTVSEAIGVLARSHIACLLVEEGRKLVGVFSDRDVLDRVALEYDAVKDRPVSDVMTKDPVYVYETDPAAAALSVMAVSGYRHVPILDLDDNLIGIISPYRVTTFLQRFFDAS